MLSETISLLQTGKQHVVVFCTIDTRTTPSETAFYTLLYSLLASGLHTKEGYERKRDLN